MRRLPRLACFVATALIFCAPEIAAACSYPPPPLPPPPAAGESEADHSTRVERWSRELRERERRRALANATAYEDRLWASAERVVLARVVEVGSAPLRFIDGSSTTVPQVSLRPVRWLKGSGPGRRLTLGFRPPTNSCGTGDVGEALGGRVGDVFLLFYGPGRPGTDTIIDSLSPLRVVTQRSGSAFEAAAAQRRR